MMTGAIQVVKDNGRATGLALAVLAAALMLGVQSAVAQGPAFPDVIPVPNGFQPEGIAVGRGPEFFVGSLVNGAIYSGDLGTGEGSLLVDPAPGQTAGGLAVDRRSNYLFVAGGPGPGRVYDAATGDLIEIYPLTTESFPDSLVNDVFVTRDAAYFTDSFRPFIYRVPLGPGGSLPAPGAVEEIELGPGFDSVPGAFNANGIVATPNGKSLIINNSELGTLYRVDPESGESSEIDLGGESLPSGDGMVLEGRTLYVVQNFLNQISVVELDPGLASGTVVDTITDPNFRIPTTAAKFGSSLYAINARFDVALPPLPGTPPSDPNIEFEIVKVSKN